MRASFSHEKIPALLEAPDYRAFAALWIEGQARKLSYSEIARVGGFSARSFPRDVILCAKRLTLNSIPKFAKGLRLPADLAAYFRTLVELAHADCRAGSHSEDDLLRLKERQRERILRRAGKGKSEADSPFQIACVPEIYAALGAPDVGATIGEILSRTRLPLETVEPALAHMLRSGIVAKKSARYRVAQLHLNLEGLKQSQVFQRHFIHSAERASRQIRFSQNSDEKLFLSSAFSVQQSDLPRLKEELRDLLLKYLDQSERAGGDKVVNLVAGLF